MSQTNQTDQINQIDKMNRNKIWVNKASSFRSGERFDEEYYLSMNRSERLEIMQFLRERYFKIKKGRKGEGRKRLRRSIRVVQQT